MNEKEKDIIDLGKIASLLWAKRKVFYIVLPIVFALSCLWIFPEPRYYTCEVKLAPEGGEDNAGSLASVATSLGLTLYGTGASDAIYPMLYPELFESPEFIADLFNIQVSNYDGDINTDYYTYLRKHQKKNWLTQPFVKAKSSVMNMFSSDPKPTPRKENEKLNPFNMNKIDYDLVEKTKNNITCNVDKKTSVISISVKDQDRKICALLADSIKDRLQEFIINYRTKKVRADVKYYQHLVDSTKTEYEKSLQALGSYNDGHRNLTLQTYVEQGAKLRNDMEVKLTAYNTFNAQLQAAKAKVQERIPSFTTLKSATIPQKPAGPKRMIFVFGMCILSFIITSLFLARKKIL